jgi:hypothetical protein
MKKLRSNSILRDVKHYFGYLLDGGYQIRSLACHSEAFGNWEVIFESSACAIQVSCDRNEVFVEFAPAKSDMKRLIGLGSMIFYLSEGQQIVGHFEGKLFGGRKKQLQKMADLLRAYLDKIAPFFGTQSGLYEAELLLAQESYNRVLLQRRMSSIKEGKLSR